MTERQRRRWEEMTTEERWACVNYNDQERIYREWWAGLAHLYRDDVDSGMKPLVDVSTWLDFRDNEVNRMATGPICMVDIEL